MSTPPRRPRKLLIAGAGLAAVSFGGGLACGSQVVMGRLPCTDPAVCGSGTTGSVDPGDGGPRGVQYCGIPDGGTPVPCGELDAGPGDGG